MIITRLPFPGPDCGRYHSITAFNFKTILNDAARRLAFFSQPLNPALFLDLMQIRPFFLTRL
jgi:hypothetical protein